MKYGFFVCFIRIQRAHFTSSQEFTNIENLFINCQTSFFETHQKRTISHLNQLLDFTSVFLALLAISSNFNNFLLSKFHCSS